MVDLNDVALFVQIVRSGSFAEAGRRLGMPSNTASRRMQQLETDMGVRLMQRSTRRLTLTNAGHAFFAQCAGQVEALTQSVQDSASGSDVPSGKVRVATPADFFNWFPMDLMRQFLETYPKVQLEFEMSDARSDLLGEGIDVAFRAGKVIEPNLIGRQLGWTRAILVASPSYIARRGTPASPADLASHDCIAFPTRQAEHATWRLDGPEGEVVVAVSGRFNANSSQAHVAAVLAGLGIAMLPSLFADPHVKAGRLHQVLPGYSMDRVGVYFVYLSRRQLPRAVGVFIEFATKAMLDLNVIESVKSLG
jgi:LysR family transcriptional regulator AphB